MINENNMLQYIDRVTPQYIAGLFDGEGCVTSWIESRSGLVKLQVEIAQKNPYILYIILLKIPGQIVTYNQKNKSGTETIFNRLRWTDARSCLKFFDLIKDHTIIKADLVNLGIQLANTILDNETKRMLSTSDRLLREELKDKISLINQSNKAKEAVNS